MLTAVELFSGGGGMAVGLRQAGMRVAAAVEVEPNAAETYKANHRRTAVVQKDIRNVSGETLLSLANGQVDVLAACPPCQGFSSLTAKYQRSDERNLLVHEVGRLVNETMPMAVMLENVPGLVGVGRPIFDALITSLESLGYICRWDVLQVADFGVPQKRRRLVLFAGHGFEIPLPSPTHSRTGGNGLRPWRTVKDAIGHMGPAMTSVEAEIKGGTQGLNWHLVRTLSPENKARLKAAKPGAAWRAIPESLRPQCHKDGYDGFSNVYGRMRWDEPSPTITAGCTTLSKGRFGHPSQNRTISVREAALLQTFPETFKFPTPYMEKVCQIIGNALPCLFAEVLAKQVASTILKQHTKA